MPDTHLAMPRTLSAPYAELLEAEAPQTTTSDALPNGTAAAAAAFAGLLAPGDQAMHPKASTSTERNPDAFRASLLATTTIPALGMTFREAADQTRALLDAYSTIPEEDEDAQKKQVREWERLEEAILTTPAQTFGDLLAKAERLLCPELGIRALEQDDDELRLLEEDVERLLPQIIAAGDADAEIFAAVTRWADLVRGCCAAKVDDDVRSLSDQADEAARDVMTHEPSTPEGLAAQVYVMLHLEHGGAAPDHLDIGFVAQSDADRPDGAAVHALVERIKRIGRPGGASFNLPLSEESISARHLADAEIFAAFERWKRDVVEVCEASDGPDDDTYAAMCRKVDAVALKVIKPAPTTMEGLAAQVYTMFHLEHGAAFEDWTDFDHKPPFDPDNPLTLAIHTIVNRVRLLGRGGNLTTAPSEAAGTLYERWTKTRARYLADGALSDGEAEALERELDQIEDQLESEPVRCVADAVAKLGYFLTVSNAMLKNGQMPNLNPRLSAPLDRILAAVEDSTPAMPETMQEPLQALAAGLRQLMQRHVTLAREAGIPTERGAAAPTPDEDLRQAWGELSALDAQVETLPPEALENGAYDAIADQARAVAGRILAAPATTIRDMEILTRFALRALILYFGIDEAEVRAWFADGTLPAGNERESVAALWRAAEGLRNLTDAAPAANDQRQHVDAFADTVAAFEAEAPATLALPLEPTGRMVDAGASAAGITPAQFQTAYAAAAEALKLERAA
ncbi:hypothetical protein [Azospirillum palustre]